MEYDIYDRQVYTITGVLKDVGGFYNALYFIGLFFYSQLSGSIFFSSFIRRLYHVEVESSDTLDPSNDSAEGGPQRRSKKKDRQHKGPKTLNDEIKEDLSRTINSKLKGSLLKTIRDYLSSRNQASWTRKDLLFQQLARLFICFRKARDLSQTEKKATIYLKGQARVIKELDCISLLTKLRMFD